MATDRVIKGRPGNIPLSLVHDNFVTGLLLCRLPFCGTSPIWDGGTCCMPQEGEGRHLGRKASGPAVCSTTSQTGCQVRFRRRVSGQQWRCLGANTHTDDPSQELPVSAGNLISRGSHARAVHGTYSRACQESNFSCSPTGTNGGSGL